MKSEDEVNEITLHVRQSSVIKMFLDPRLCNQRGGSISNLKCFLLLFVYSEVNITYSIYLLLRGFPINCSLSARAKAIIQSLVWYILTKGMFKMNDF